MCIRDRALGGPEAHLFAYGVAGELEDLCDKATDAATKDCIVSIRSKIVFTKRSATARSAASGRPLANCPENEC